MEGNTATVSWVDSTTAVCGSCHSLAPTGHLSYDISACGGCHMGVVNASGVILDNKKHINGNVNVFGEEYPMF